MLKLFFASLPAVSVCVWVCLSTLLLRLSSFCSLGFFLYLFIFPLDIGFIREITVYPCNIESIDWHRSLTEYSWNAFLSHSTARVNACCQQPLIKYCTFSLLNDDSAPQLSVLYLRILHPQKGQASFFPSSDACCTK